MKLLNKKAMTLFELLAVIIILGVIAAIAFPTVNRLIDNQRRSAFAEEANLFVQSAVQLAEDEYEFIEYDTFTYFLNPTDDDQAGDFDISDEFPKLSSDYYGKITFSVDDEGKLSITSIVFKNDNYEIIEPTNYFLTMRFDRSDVNEVKK